MSRNLVEKVIYRRRTFVTRQRIRTAAEVISQLLPMVATGKPSATRLAGALETLANHSSNDIPPQVAQESNLGLRKHITELRAQLHNAPNAAETKRLREKLDVLYDLLLEEAEHAAEKPE